MPKNFYSNVLNENQIKKVHASAVKILGEIGTDIYNEKAMDILCSAGAKRIGHKTVTIPESLIEDAINHAPKRIDIYDRNGNLKMKLEGDNVYFGMGPTCPYVIDPYTNKRRLFTRKDCVRGAILGDYLDNIDFIMSMGTISDIHPAEHFELYAFCDMVSNTDKPLIISAVNEEDLSKIYEIACMIKGGEKEFLQKPFFIQYCETTTPLKHSDTALQKLIFCSEKTIPLVYTPAPCAGSTAPVTLAGTLSLGTAEVLTGLVLNQIISKGAPFIYGGVFSVLDMKTMNFSYGAPEFLLFIGALADIAAYYGLPSFTTGGCSDSKIFDEQAAGEYALSLMASYMSSSNLVHDVGFLEFGMTGSYEGIVYGNEIISLLKRIGRGIDIDDEALAFDVLKEIGVGGHFLSHEHTLTRFRDELWHSNLFDRSSYSKWKANGEKDLRKILNEKVIEILETHTGHKLEPTIENKIAEILSMPA